MSDKGGNDWGDVALVLLGTWPQQVSSWGEVAVEAYVNELAHRGLTPEAAGETLRSMTGEFPPSAASVAARWQRKAQGAPPEFMSVMRFIASKVSMLDYHEPSKNFDRFIARCAEEHESIARFALEMGPLGVRRMPDPRFVQDQGGSVELTRMEQSYKEIKRGWTEDPTPGLALTEARRQGLGRGTGDLSAGGGFKQIAEGAGES